MAKKLEKLEKDYEVLKNEKELIVSQIVKD